MQSLGTKEVATLLGISEPRVRRFVHAGFLSPSRTSRGAFVFTFRDLVLMRTAKGLVQERVSARRMQAVLRKLRKQLPEDKHLAGVRVFVDGKDVVVQDADAIWNPESGQSLFDFDVGALEAEVQKLRPKPRLAKSVPIGADGWHRRGVEASDPAEAIAAFRHAIACDPEHFEALLSWGAASRSQSDLEAACTLFSRAKALRPEDPIPSFELARTHQLIGDVASAVDGFRAAIEIEPLYRDAYLYLARLYEQTGETQLALRMWSDWRKLS